LEESGKGSFVDLDYLATISKSTAAKFDKRKGVDDHVGARDLARAIGRKFSRFPFPDGVSEWFRPLQVFARRKYDNPASPEGRVLGWISQFRVEAPTWASGPYDLTLDVIVRAGRLPPFSSDDAPSMPDSLKGWLKSKKGPALSEICDRLLRATDPEERFFLWLALAEALADKCKPNNKDLLREEVRAAVNGGRVVADVVSEDEFNMVRYGRSESLDLSDLSPPDPS
jgi:hypothetical protein